MWAPESALPAVWQLCGSMHWCQLHWNASLLLLGECAQPPSASRPPGSCCCCRAQLLPTRTSGDLSLQQGEIWDGVCGNGLPKLQARAAHAAHHHKGREGGLWAALARSSPAARSEHSLLKCLPHQAPTALPGGN
jgi:hypothetical protein